MFLGSLLKVGFLAGLELIISNNQGVNTMAINKHGFDYGNEGAVEFCSNVAKDR